MWTRGFKGARAPPVRAREPDRQVCTVCVTCWSQGLTKSRTSIDSFSNFLTAGVNLQFGTKWLQFQSNCALVPPRPVCGAPGAVQELSRCWNEKVQAAVRGPEPRWHFVCSNCLPVHGHKWGWIQTSSEKKKKKEKEAAAAHNEAGDQYLPAALFHLA